MKVNIKSLEVVPDSFVTDANAKDYADLMYTDKPTLGYMEYLIGGAVHKSGSEYVQEWVVCKPSNSEIISSFEHRVEQLLNKTANEHGYDSIATAVSYADESAVPRFQLEGQAFRRWRSRVWDYAYNQLALVQTGDKPIPKPEDFLAGLPKFNA